MPAPCQLVHAAAEAGELQEMSRLPILAHALTVSRSFCGMGLKLVAFPCAVQLCFLHICTLEHKPVFMRLFRLCTKASLLLTYP